VPFRLFPTYPGDGTEAQPAWSPDGQHLAYDLLDLDAWENARKTGASGLYAGVGRSAVPLAARRYRCCLARCRASFVSISRKRLRSHLDALITSLA